MIVGFYSFTSLHHYAVGALIWALLFVLRGVVSGYGFYFASLIAVSGGARVFLVEAEGGRGPEVDPRFVHPPPRIQLHPPPSG